MEVVAPAIGQSTRGLAAGVDPGASAQLGEVEPAAYGDRSVTNCRSGAIADLTIVVNAPAIGPVRRGLAAAVPVAQADTIEVEPARYRLWPKAQVGITRAECSRSSIAPAEGT